MRAVEAAGAAEAPAGRGRGGPGSPPSTL